ncbi:SusC/RagA family TonB-linked outer membrane protein [Flavobacterium palustre]|uniref:SusC/RagA family TonB-linked outer membrane protein n=1 Tax=Flavobacterium palustre TaxID=1476463 RepID=A0ABQ1HMD9_9FLAO|nr:TonB-dependent receptor [Flavobacterium palustre]GGA83270.1 SusC/RagA family TonB-linked outer membrane protein [Flavobacterium palustre]
MKKIIKGKWLSPYLPKISLKMKLTTLLLILSLVRIQASTYSQNTKLTLNVNNTTVEQLFNKIESVSEYRFLFESSLIDLDRKVSVNVEKKKIVEILDKVFKGTDISYTINDRQILLVKKKEPTVSLATTVVKAVDDQGTIQVSGVVMDENNMPMPGLSVAVKGKSISTSTDMDGKFKFNAVDPNGFLVFSYVGYKDQVVEIKNRSVINVTMKIDVNELNEVVVNYGFGKVKKADMTGATATITSKELSKIPVSSAAEALKGRLPGVNVTSADGEPGASIRIRVRGGTSISQNNDPLFIVDGLIVGSIDNIPVNDIASIDVLKDAAATAIYGSQGSNGVIVVTTKNPVAGRVTVSYNNFFQFNQLPKDRKYDVLSPYEFALANYEYAALLGTTQLQNFEKFFGKYDDLELYKQKKPTDWQDELFGGSRLSQSHNLSIGGGNEMTKINLSLTNNNEEGLLTGSAYDRTAINFKLNQEIFKNLKADFTARITNTVIDGAGTSTNAQLNIKDAVQTRPVNGIADELEFDPTQVSSDDDYQQFIQTLISPTELVKQDWRKRTNNQYVFSAGLTWSVFKDLDVKSTLTTSRDYSEQLRFYGPLTGESYNNGGNLPLGERTITESNSYRLVNTINYRKKWDGIKLDVLIGQDISSLKGKFNFLRGEDYRVTITPQELFANMQFGRVDRIDGGENTPFNRKSYFGRFDFQLKERYIWTLTARADQSSKFRGKNNLGIFPALAFAWKINKESFLDKADFIDDLKLRVSYGQTGNDGVSTEASQFLFNGTTLRGPGFGNVDNLYYTPSSSVLYNPNIKWESTATNNIGLDFAFFRNKLSGSFDYYNNETRDLLYQSAIPNNTGFDKQFNNVGSTSNRGFELALSSVVVDSKDFNLSVNANIGRNEFRIDKLDGTSDLFARSNWASTDLKNVNDFYLQLGGKVGDFYGFVTDGFYSVDDFDSYNSTTARYVLKDGVPNSGALVGNANIRPGFLKIKDLNNDGVINDDDRKVLGNATPDFQGGFGFNVSYKGFDLSTFFDYQVGNEVYNTGKIQYNQFRRITYGNLLTSMSSDKRFTYVDVDGQYTGTPGGIVTDLGQLAEMNEGKTMWSHSSFGVAQALISDFAIEDGSFLRLNNVTLGYSLPKKIISKVGLSQFRIYATGRNLHIWTKYSGYDPDVNSQTRDPLTPGVDYSSFPKSRSYTFGLNATF